MSEITFIGYPKPFIKDWASIQTKAIKSWLEFGDVILCGNEEGVGNFCKENGLTHCPDTEMTLYGHIVQTELYVKTPISCRMSCDCIVLDGIDSAINVINDTPFYCVASGRYNTYHEITDLDFERTQYKNYERSVSCYCDIHIYKTGIIRNVPKIMIGMGGDDNWVNKYFWKLGGLVYSNDLIVLHQDHSREYIREPNTPLWTENQKILADAGGGMNLDVAQYILENGKLIKNGS